MFRAATVLACAVLTLGPARSDAQQRGWIANLNGGYANGIGDNFEGPGSVSATGFIYRRVGGNIDLGVEIGYHGLGTSTTRLSDLYGPGSTYREDFTWSVWQATAGVRVRPAATRVRPYAAASTGAYLLRIRDVIEVRDAAGELIPQYQFRQTDAELHPGVNAGVGVDRLVSLGRLGLGLHARWHGIIAPGGIADFFTVSVGLALD
jgi:hypothetical protein